MCPAAAAYYERSCDTHCGFQARGSESLDLSFIEGPHRHYESTDMSYCRC